MKKKRQPLGEEVEQREEEKEQVCPECDTVLTEEDLCPTCGKHLGCTCTCE